MVKILGVDNPSEWGQLCNLVCVEDIGVASAPRWINERWQRDVAAQKIWMVVHFPSIG